LNNKGQLVGVAFFIMLVAMMIIVAPIILKVGFTILDTTSAQLSTIDSTNVSSDNVNFVKNKIVGTFDWTIMILVIINMLVLLVTAFLIDIHPAFLVIYIIGAFVMVITLPYTMAVAENIYGSTQFSVGSDNVVQYIPMTEFMLNNFGTIMVGILILSGIIMYAKFRSSSRGGTTY